MYLITKDFAFEAGHHLTKVPEGHKCGRPHGHSYRVRVQLASVELNEMGFVVDYGELDALKQFIDETLDHRVLNEVVDFETTAENLAAWLFGWCVTRWPQVVAVGVSETAKTWAWYRPGQSGPDWD